MHDHRQNESKEGKFLSEATKKIRKENQPSFKEQGYG
jgi:hypothetical protein